MYHPGAGKPCLIKMAAQAGADVLHPHQTLASSSDYSEWALLQIYGKDRTQNENITNMHKGFVGKINV